MDEFEKLLRDVSSGVERFVRYRLPSQTDADDVLQEVYLTAYRKFSGLKNKDAFKPWIISIARNKCNDYFRAKAAQMEISIEELSQQELSTGRLGISVVHTVRETLDRLGDKDKQILYLEGAAPNRNSKAAGYSYRDGEKQASYSQAAFQKQISISNPETERRYYYAKTA